MIEINPTYAAIAGAVAGCVYFAHSESSVPTDSNCSYLAPWTTDLFAWIG
jgi:hypothetical protein